MTRVQRSVYWGFPLLFCLFVYWYGLKTWFAQDDFAWLSLPNTIHNWHDFWDAVFAPKAQGTIRPWSERLFFLGFEHFFGFDARPFRVWVFLNECLNLALLTALTYRLTNSRVAGVAAPILWTANTSLVTAMSWTSAYNEVQCSSFLLGALYLFVRYTQTNDRRFLHWQWVVFVLGFGSLELNVVYPALALVYALCCAPKYWRYTLPMFGVSALYTLIHRSFAPHASGETSWFYRMYFDTSLFHSFAVYWNWLMGFSQYCYFHGYASNTPGHVVTAIVTLALAGFVAERLWRRQWVVLIGPAWYLIVLAPVLPLRNHVTEYYLTMPSIGLALLGAYALGVAWQNRLLWRIVAVVLALTYLGANVPVTRTLMKTAYDHSKRVEVLVESVAYARRLHPNSVLLLDGIDSDLFWSAIYDRSFQAYGIHDVYLSPDSHKEIKADPNLSSIEGYFLPASVVQQSLPKQKIQVYRVGDTQLTNITHQYAQKLIGENVTDKPRSVDLTSSLFDDQLGPGWPPYDGGYRWIGKSATVYLGGPQNAEQKLYVRGVCPVQSVEPEPQQLLVSVNGVALTPVKIDKSNLSFDLYLPLPPSLVGQPEVKVVLTVHHTMRIAPDPRDLGLAIGTVAIQ